MFEAAIRVESLSKRYRVGRADEVPDSLVGMLGSALTRPARNLRRSRRLSSFREDGRGREDVIRALKDVSFEVEQGEWSA